MLSSGAPSVNYSGCVFAVALRCMPWTHGIWHRPVALTVE